MDVVMKEGWIEKEGGSTKSWKRRWVVLYEVGRLEYYNNNKRKEMKGKIDLEEVKAVNLYQNKYKGRLNVFTLEMPSRTYYMQAPNEEELQKWVIFIRQAYANTKSTHNATIAIKPHPQAEYNKLPNGWKMHFNYLLKRPYFVDYTVDPPKSTYQDPRPLPPNIVLKKDTQGNPVFVDEKDGKEMRYDPRPPMYTPTTEQDNFTTIKSTSSSSLSGVEITLDDIKKSVEEIQKKDEQTKQDSKEEDTKQPDSQEQDDSSDDDDEKIIFAVDSMVVAKYDYVSRGLNMTSGDKDLSFSKGDIMKVLKDFENDWVRVSLKDQTGVVPSTFVSKQ